MKTCKPTWWIAVVALLILGTGSLTPARSARQPRPAAGATPYLELYVKQGAKTWRLSPGDLTFRTVLTLGPELAGLYGIPGPPATRLDIQPLEILVFDPEGAGATLRLDKLAYVETAPAHTFDLKTTRVDAASFEKVYRVPFDQAASIKLWAVGDNIPLHYTPVAGKPGWYRAVPDHALDGGAYAINFGCLEGPRVYTGKLNFYPFMLAAAPPPACPAPPKKRRIKRRRAVECPPVAACPPSKTPAPAPVRSGPPSQLDAGFTYVAEASPEGRREYQITNTNNIPWHNVNISVFMRDSRFPKTVLGPVTLYKDIVLPDHTVSQKPDQTFLQYETLNDAGATLYLKVKSKEGVIKKAWKNLGPEPGSGRAALTEVPYDLKDNEE
jgi:hypothetical protein